MTKLCRNIGHGLPHPYALAPPFHSSSSDCCRLLWEASQQTVIFKNLFSFFCPGGKESTQHFAPQHFVLQLLELNRNTSRKYPVLYLNVLTCNVIDATRVIKKWVIKSLRYHAALRLTQQSAKQTLDLSVRTEVWISLGPLKESCCSLPQLNQS